MAKHWSSLPKVWRKIMENVRKVGKAEEAVSVRRSIICLLFVLHQREATKNG